MINANGDGSLQGELIFGISTQSDNTLPATGNDRARHGSDERRFYRDLASGDHATVHTAADLIDSGTTTRLSSDPTITVCSTGSFGGSYYCPASAPRSLFAVNSGVGVNNAMNTRGFRDLRSEHVRRRRGRLRQSRRRRRLNEFTWGMPFFYGHKIYIGNRPACRPAPHRPVLRLLNLATRSAAARQFLGDRRETRGPRRCRPPTRRPCCAGLIGPG